MNKKLNILEKSKLWYYVNKSSIHVVLIFVIILFSGIAFTVFRNTHETLPQDISMYTESTEVLDADYERIFGYAPMDSTVPPVTGIKVKYNYQVNNQNFTGKQTFYKGRFREIMNGINKAPETLEVRYKSNNPKESVITIRKH